MTAPTNAQIDAIHCALRANWSADLTIWKDGEWTYTVTFGDGTHITGVEDRFLQLLISGASAQGQSVYNYDRAEYVCGTVHQLDQPIYA